jgi:predicted RNA-binding protein YlqC (UPF0109 family)
MTPAIMEALTLIQIMVLAIVDDQKSVSVTGEQTPAGYRIDVRTATTDCGKVIGKQGRNARSLRTILNCHGMRTKQVFNLNILQS